MKKLSDVAKLHVDGVVLLINVLFQCKNASNYLRILKLIAQLTNDFLIENAVT